MVTLPISGEALSRLESLEDWSAVYSVSTFRLGCSVTLALLCS